MSYKIVHRSRYIEHILTFATTENTLTWNIKAACNGQFYEVTGTNINSYLIGGTSSDVSRTNPYVVSAQVSYSVSITKITSGIAASLTIKERRSSDAAINYTVPDLTPSYATGRYLYAVSNTTLYVLDKDLLKSTNSTGDGTWTTTPIIAAYSLPQPVTIYWQFPKFIKYKGDLGSILIVGKTVGNAETQGSSYVYVCYFDIKNSKIYNATGTENSATLSCYYNAGLIQNIYYNYVTEKVAIVGYPANTTMQLLKLDTSTGISTQFSSARAYQTLEYAVPNYFNPVTEEFSRYANHNVFDSTIQITGFKSYSTTAAGHNVFCKNRNKHINITSDTSSISTLVEFDDTGNIIRNIQLSGLSITAGTCQTFAYDANSSILMYTVGLQIIWVDLNNITTKKSRILTTLNNSGHTQFRNMINCAYTGYFYARGWNTADVRLFVFEPDYTNVSTIVRYIDMPEIIYGITSNQLY